MEITRRIEFDAGHRIPAHKSKCRHLHGHRYVLEATVAGPVKMESGEADEGMVKDFSDLRQILMEEIHENWDHAFLAWSEDHVAHAAADFDPTLHFVWFDVVPTVENLATIAFNIIAARIYRDWESDRWLERVRLYETPNCWADVQQIDGVDDDQE